MSRIYKLNAGYFIFKIFKGILLLRKRKKITLRMNDNIRFRTLKSPNTFEILFI